MAAALALAALLGVAPAPAPEWRLAAIDARLDSMVYVDAAGIVRAGDQVRFESEVQRRDPGPLSGRSMRQLVTADCVTRSWRSVSRWTYRAHGRSNRAEETVTLTAPPRSTHAAVIAAACARTFVGGAIASPSRHAGAFFAAEGDWRARLAAADAAH
jgi:hypothetical protein